MRSSVGPTAAISTLACPQATRPTSRSVSCPPRTATMFEGTEWRMVAASRGVRSSIDVSLCCKVAVHKRGKSAVVDALFPQVVVSAGAPAGVVILLVVVPAEQDDQRLLCHAPELPRYGEAA